MLAFFPAVAVAALVPLASALTIIEPNSGGWTGNTTVQIRWSYTQDDPNFSIELGNPKIQSGILAQGPIAIANNVNPNIGSIPLDLPVLPPGDNYFVAFVAVNDVNTVYANSSSFTIRDNPTSSTAPLSTFTRTGAVSTTTKTNTTRTSTTTSSHTNGTHTGTSTTSGTTTPTSSSITTLVITTATTTATSSTRSGGAVPAAHMEAAWYVGAVGAFLGAIFA